MNSYSIRNLLLGAFLLAGSASLTGCGPVQASVAIADSEKALESAGAAQAETLAPYPFYRAEAFLFMAKTKAGFAEYEIAREYAIRAKDDAEAAEEKARRRYRLMKLREKRIGGGIQ